MMESLLPEYSKFGAVRQPSGSSLPGISPSNAYLCRDGRYALIAGNGDSIFKRLMKTIGREDLAADAQFANNEGRAEQAELLDIAISAWTIQKDLDEILDLMEKSGVPAGLVYDAADIDNDAHYKARNMLLQAELPDKTKVTVPGIVPKLSLTPGEVRTPAPSLGQHTAEVLSALGIDEETRLDWQRRQII